MRFRYQSGDEIRTVDLVKTSAGYRASMNGQDWPVVVVRNEPGELTMMLGDEPLTIQWAADGMRRWIFNRGKTFMLTATTFIPSERKGRREREQAHSGERMILAPMPGHVRAIQVAEGDGVAKGQTLILLEAMKMEIRIQAPRAGRLKRLLVQKGVSVERDQVLCEIE